MDLLRRHPLPGLPTTRHHIVNTATLTLALLAATLAAVVATGYFNR